MRPTLIFIFVQLSTIIFSQTQDKINSHSNIPLDSINFVTTMNIANATKEGIYLNGYIVNISYDEAKEINGKTIKISGKVTIIKGLKNLPKEYDEKGNEIIRQGREEDTKYIEFPIIEIIKI
jgi:hypothetical protein